MQKNFKVSSFDIQISLKLWREIAEFCDDFKDYDAAILTISFQQTRCKNVFQQ